MRFWLTYLLHQFLILIYVIIWPANILGGVGQFFKPGQMNGLIIIFILPLFLLGFFIYAVLFAWIIGRQAAEFNLKLSIFGNLGVAAVMLFLPTAMTLMWPHSEKSAEAVKTVMAVIWICYLQYTLFQSEASKLSVGVTSTISVLLVVFFLVFQVKGS